MTKSEIIETIEKQKKYFNTGITKSYEFRHKHLKILRDAIIKNEENIFSALKKDLNKPELETYFSEVIMLLQEIDYAIKNLKKWMKSKKIRSSMMLFPSKGYIYPEPYGLVLIMAPWNYPVQLLLTPLIGSISSGNCSILKPSEKSNHTSDLLAKIMTDNFDPSYVSIVEGGVEESSILLSQKYDYIFYTGNPTVGKIVMESASKYLTPVTLELGGKSPCIIDKDIDVKITAERIVWGKFLNAGQTCIAPDYLLVHKEVKNDLFVEMRKALERCYGNNPKQSPDFARIINIYHFDRLSALLNEGNIITGGVTDKETKYIAPTIIDNISWESKIMQEEIFGPILPVIEFEYYDSIIKKINEREKPLALYIFSKNTDKQKKIVCETSSGGMTINDTLLHVSSKHLPFGGVGFSGLGSYHGYKSFDTFSHKKSILKRYFFFDTKFKYPPYPKLTKSMKRIINFVSK
jgi:aldehyde dehydrogenase (NAD+)